MDNNTLISFFYKLSSSCNNIYNWVLDEHFNIVFSDCPYPDVFIKLMGEVTKERINETTKLDKYSCIYLIQSVIGWIASVKKNGNESSIYLKGPFFNNFYEEKIADELFNNLKLTESEKDTLRNNLTGSSAIVSAQMFDLVKMLHFCINGELLNQTEIEAHNINIVDDNKVSFSTDQYDKTSKGYALEKTLLNYVRNGDPSVSQLAAKMTNTPPLRKKISPDDLDIYKSDLNVLLTLLSRTAVEGGMVQKTSFALCAQYRNRIAACKSINELMLLSNDCILDYTERVRKSKIYANCDPSIRLCCEYIDTHLSEKLSLDVLAKKAGYTKHHFSRKFHEEMGISITDYICKSKIEEAKFRLVNYDQTIEEIAHDLCFASRSYFTGVFQKYTGVSPSEYRKNNKIL